MAAKTGISWTDHTWNPWIGCTHVHEGCTHCYAEADQDQRRGRVKWGPLPHGTRSRTSDDYWKQPPKWDRNGLRCTCGADRTGPSAEAHDAGCAAGRRPRVFCASLADVFEDWQGPIVDAQGRPLVNMNGVYAQARVGDGWPMAKLDDLRRDLFALIDRTPNLDWLLLTKRPENVQRMWPLAWSGPDFPGDTADSPHQTYTPHRANVWLGYSASNQRTLEQGIGSLLACRPLCRGLFLSLEPLLGPADLSNYLPCFRDHDTGLWMSEPWLHSGEHPPISWVITGCESGPQRRPWSLEWDQDIEQQCRAAGVAFFRKQILIGDGRVSTDPAEWPEELRVQQFPEAR